MTFSRMPRCGNFCIKLISIFLIPTFIVSNLAYAAPTTESAKTSSQAITVTNPESIVVPREFGLVKTKFSGKDDRLVIHIQDAHCNYEAQSNIVKILENLHKNYNVSLVSVEGADGVIDTSWFKAFPDDEVRKEVADYFMKKGEITGPEFLSITTDYNIKLFGAETRSYYIDNLNAFTSSYPLKSQTEKYLNSIKSALNKLKTYIYSEDLRLMDAKYQDYDSKKLAFNDYVKFLQVEAEKAKINLRAYENFFKLVSVLVYEKKIDFTVTDKERSALIDNLSKAISKEALTDLVNKSLEFKTGKVSSADYYAYLKALAINNGMDLAKDYPNLYNYIIYNSVYSKIENEKLFNDIKKLEGDIKEKLFTNDDQRMLEKLSRHIEILIGLVNIKLLNGDYEYFEKNKAEFSHEIFSDFLKKKAIQYGLAYEVEDPNEAVAKALPKLEDFYSIAIKRDKALVDNTLGQMSKDKSKVAVLVTGGFHSEGMAKLLEKQGVSYMVVCPSITKDLPTPYIQILTNQKTPLQDILVTPVHASEGPAIEKQDVLAPPLRTELATLSDDDLEVFLNAVKGGAELKASVERLKDDWYKISVNGIRLGDVEVVEGYIDHMRSGVGGVSGSATIIIDNMMKGLKSNFDEIEMPQANRARIRAAIQEAVSQIPSLRERMINEATRIQARNGLQTPGTGGSNSVLSIAQAGSFGEAIKIGFDSGKVRLIVMNEIAPGFQFVTHEDLVELCDERGLPTNVHPGRGGYVDGISRAKLQAHIDRFIYDGLDQGERNTIAKHELAHLYIFNVEEAVKSGMSEGEIVLNMSADAYSVWNAWKNAGKPAGEAQEKFVNSLPERDVIGSGISAKIERLAATKRLKNMQAAIDADDVAAMEKILLRDRLYGSAVADEINKAKEAVRGEDYERFIRSTITRRYNIDRANATLINTPYEGYDIVIISSTTPDEANYQQALLEQAFNGVATHNNDLGNKVCILSVMDESEGGQVLGQVNTWLRAKEAFEVWANKNGVAHKDLDKVLDQNRARIAIYHNGGKGERFSPGSQGYGNSRGAQNFRNPVSAPSGSVNDANLILGVVMSTAPIAMSMPDERRIDTYWANQVAFGTIDLAKVQRSNYAFDKMVVKVPKNAKLKDLFDYGTAIIDRAGKILKFLANKVLTKKDSATGKYVENPDYAKELAELKASAKGSYDYGSFSMSKALHSAMVDYWANVRKNKAVIEGKGRAGLARDIDPAFVQIAVPIMSGLSGKTISGLPSASELDASADKNALLDKAYRSLISIMTPEFAAAVEKVYKKSKDAVLETVEMMVRYPGIFADTNKVVGSMDLGENSHWFAFKRLLDMANNRLLMLSDILGKNIEIEPSGKIAETPATTDDVIKAEDARRMFGITADSVCIFEVNGKTITLSAEQVKKGWSGEGVEVKGSIIQGKCVLLPGSKVINSFIHDSQGLIAAENSYLESCIAPAISAVNSILIKAIDTKAVKADKEIVADAFRPEIRDARFAEGHTRMRAPIGYDPKPAYTVYDNTDKNNKVVVRDSAGKPYEFKINSKNELVDSSGGVAGTYVKIPLASSVAYPAHRLTETIWLDKPVDGVLTVDVFYPNEKSPLSAELMKALEKELKQGPYYATQEGKFLTKAMADMVRFGDNEYSFQQIRAMDCNRTANDAIENKARDIVQKTLERAAMKHATAKRLSFGTSGLRGIDANMTDEEIYINTRGFIEYLFSVPVEKGGIRPGDSIDVAADFRPSSKIDRIPRAVAAAIIDSGCKVIYCGNISTPAVANYGMHGSIKRASIMITASHNPYYFEDKDKPEELKNIKGPVGYNGIKFNRPNGEILKTEEGDILDAVAKIRLKEYMKPADQALFKDDGWFKDIDTLGVSQSAFMRGVQRSLASSEQQQAESDYTKRYTDAFGKVFDGEDVLVYQHTAVGTRLLADIFEKLGAKVKKVGEADKNKIFKAVDTEDIKDWVKTEIKEAVKEFARDNAGKMPFAIITTDGDSDRPAVFYIVTKSDGDFDVEYIPGNKLGILTSLFLRPDFVALTATADNAAPNALRQNGINAEIFRAKVGSPYVNKVMIDKMTKEPNARCVAFEGNGGYLTGSDIDVGSIIAEQFPGRGITGGVLKALPTRDATLPMIATLLMAKKTGSLEKLVTDTFVSDAKGYADAALVENVTPGCEAYTTDMGKKIIASITPAVKGLNAVSFKAGAVIIEEDGKAPVPASAALATQMNSIANTIKSYLEGVEGLGEISRIEYIDGVRIYFDDKFRDIVHLRPSGNAPQFRVYSEANDQARARYIVDSRLNFMPKVIAKFTSSPQAAGRATPGVYAVSPGASNMGLLETVSVTINVEASLDNLFNNRPAALPESETLKMLETEINDYIKFYSKLNNKDDLKRYLKLVAERALDIDDIKTSKGLQIMAGQALAIISLIEDAIPGLDATKLRVTSDTNGMVKAKDKNRGPSYLSAESVRLAGSNVADNEGDEGVYFRGVEDVTKLGVVLSADYTRVAKLGPNISVEAMIPVAKEKFITQMPKVVMYLMLHVGRYHTTVFLHDTLPGSIQVVSTGPGHFQASKGDNVTDLKEPKGEVIQLSVSYNINNQPTSVLVQQVGAADENRIVAPSGTVDSMVPGSAGVVFNDTSIVVSEGEAAGMADIVRGTLYDVKPSVMPYIPVKINGQVKFVANDNINTPIKTVTGVKLPGQSLKGLYDAIRAGKLNAGDIIKMVMDAMRNWRLGAAPTVTPDQVARTAQIASFRQIGFRADPVRINLAWGTEDWRNSIHVDPKNPGKYISPISGSSVTLLELYNEAPDIFGEEFIRSPFFTKILDTGDFPKVVYVGLKPGVDKNTFARLLKTEHDNVNALLASLKPGVSKDDFDAFRAAYSLWAIEQAKSDWKASGDNINRLESKMAGFISEDTRSQRAFAVLLYGMEKNRAEIVSNLNKIDLAELEEGDSILCRTDTIHAIFGLSLQVHGPAGEKGTEKNEAWVITKRSGKIVLEEPQQVSNTTHSIADFFTPIEWKAAENKSGLRKTDIAEKIDTSNPSSVINNNVNFESTSIENIVIKPTVVSQADGVTRLAMIDREDWPYFRSEVIRFTSGPGTAKISAVKGTSLQLSVFGAGVVIQIGDNVIELKDEDTYLVPAGNTETIQVKSKGVGEVRIYSKPVVGPVVGDNAKASEIIAAESAHVDNLKKTLARTEVKNALNGLDADDGFIINAFDTAIKDSQGTIQLAQALVEQEAGSRIINVRGTGTALLDAIQKAIASHPGKIRTVVTTTPDQKIAASAMQYGSVVNVQQIKDNKDRYMPIPGLQDLALRIAVANVLYKDKTTSGYTKDGARFVFQALDRIALQPDNKPFTINDVMELLKKGFFRILPRIVPVDLAAAREAYIAAKTALQSL